MPSWLADDPTPVYVVLGALALIVLPISWMNRDRSIALGSSKDKRREPRTINALILGALVIGFLLLLAGVARLIDHLVVSDHEQIELSVREMAGAVVAGDTERVFRQVSERFLSPNHRDKKAFREFARQYIDKGQVQDIVVWDFRFEQPASRQSRSGTVFFLVKVRGDIVQTHQDLFYRVEAKYRLDEDNRWRMEGFQLMDPVANQVIPLPP